MIILIIIILFLFYIPYMYVCASIFIRASKPPKLKASV